MTGFSKRALPFIAIGTAFLGFGLTGRRTFTFVGIAFIVIGIVFMVRGARR